jgi:hypothetical protein
MAWRHFTRAPFIVQMNISAADAGGGNRMRVHAKLSANQKFLTCIVSHCDWCVKGKGLCLVAQLGLTLDCSARKKPSALHNHTLGLISVPNEY